MYNEESNAAACVTALIGQLRQFSRRTALLAVNDGSTDRTGQILTQLAGQYPELQVLSHRGNCGYGAAVASGIARAHSESFDYALFMDSDLTNHPRYIADFVAAMDTGIDLIKASRFVRGGAMEGVPAYRAFISIVGNQVARALLRVPLTDCTNGFRAARVPLLASIPLRETGFAVIMEELYHLKWLARSFSEVPYTLTARGGAQGRSKFHYGVRVLWHYLRYPLRAALGIRPTTNPNERQEAASHGAGGSAAPG